MSRNGGVRAPVYISAPYAGTPAERAWNAARAAALARLAVAEGRAPIVVHTDIEAGVYGDDGSPSGRATGLDCDLSLLRLVAQHSRGSLWELLPLGGERTPGMRRERLLWSTMPNTRRRSTVQRWLGWRSRFTRAGLVELWWELEAPPVVAAQ